MIKKLLSKIINRKVITMFIIAVQMAWCIVLVYNTAVIYPIINTLFYAIGLGVVVYIINRDTNPSYKIAWILPIMAFPLFGVLISRFMSDALILSLSGVGSILIFAVGVNLIRPKTIKVGNFLPALLVPILYQLIIYLFGLWGITW